MGDNFAPANSKLSQSGIGVAAAPSGGMGLALNDLGLIPLSALPILVSAQAGSITTSSTTYVDLTSGPSLFIQNSGNYLIFFGVHCSMQTAIFTDMYCATYASISGIGGMECINSSNVQFDGRAGATLDFRALVQGESLGLRVKNGAANSVIYDRGWIVAVRHRPS